MIPYFIVIVHNLCLMHIAAAPNCSLVQYSLSSNFANDMQQKTRVNIIINDADSMIL